MLHKLAKKVSLLTAGGVTSCVKGIKIRFLGLSHGELEAHVLDDTPPVISMGALCQREGYAFHWPHGSERPYFVTPHKGKKIYCEVDRFIPYLVFDGVDEADCSLPCKSSQ